MSNKESTAAKTPPPDSIVNRTPIEVTFTNGKKGLVFIRRLTIRELRDFANAIFENEVYRVVAQAIHPQVDEDWIDTLTDESFNELQAKVQAENFPRAMAQAMTNPAIAAKLGPVVQSALRLASIQREVGRLSRKQLPEDAPSGSAEETGSGSSTSLQPDSVSSSPSASGS